MNYRKQMTPCMKACKDKYGGSKSSPYKATPTDSQLIKGAGKAVDKPKSTALDSVKTALDTGKPMLEYAEANYDPS